MNRRQFGKNAIGLMAIGTSAPAALLVEGCTGSQVINEINVVLKEAAAVLAVAEPGAPWIAPLQQAIAALLAAEQQWQTGSTVQLVIDALDVIVAVTAVIPLTAPYSPLIDILVAGIEAVLAALPQSSNNAGRKATAAGNPHIGRYQFQTHWYRKTPDAAEFKSAWNNVAITSPALAAAVLK
jgi:hypothetical protein